MSDDALVPRLCHLVKWPDFNGFGFNLHAERGKAGQYIGKVDEGSPAEAAGLKPKDRIVEVNGSNIGNENHQQVVMRIRAGGDETKLLVVDAETDAKYKESKVVIRADLPEVLYTRADPPPGQSADNGDVVDAAPEPEQEQEPEPEPEITAVSSEVSESAPSDQMNYRPRYCHMRKWADFDGYGFNLHAEKDKPGQYIGKIDEGSPAEAAHLREGDRIVEVNNENIEDSTHQQVIGKIKAGGSETRLLVVDKEVDEYYKSHGIRVHDGMPQIDRYTTPLTSGKGSVEPEIQAAAALAAEAPHSVDVEVEQGGLASVQDEQEPDTEQEPQPEVQAEPEPEQEAEETFVASEAEVVAAAFDHAADDDVTGLADEGTEAEEQQQQPPPYQHEEEEEEAVEEKVEAEQNAEAEAEPEEAQEDHVSQRPMNGQQTVITTTSEPAREPERAPSAAVSNGDPLAMSAKEMRERLAAKKRSDPRNQKMDFRTKHQMFEKM